jgi:colicin import membrane protein
VTKVTILSGDSNVCRAAQTAVLRSDTLPVSREPDVYQQLKDINITVRPENV